jgi:hypothetical protein
VIGDCVQDKDKLPAPLKSMDLRSGYKGMGDDNVPSPSNTDRIIQQTVGITASPGGTPGYTTPYPMSSLADSCKKK